MVTKQPLIRSMRTVKRETLKLISGWVSRSNDPQMVSSDVPRSVCARAKTMSRGWQQYKALLLSLQVGENFVPPLLEAVLIDYQRNVPAAREPEVLSTMATIVNKLGAHITGEIPKIFDAVFECTLEMINKVSPSCLSVQLFRFISWVVSSESNQHKSSREYTLCRAEQLIKIEPKPRH